MAKPILSTDSETEARHKTNYTALIVNNYAEREDDQLAHVEDTDLYSVIRKNKLVYVPWNQVTDAEHRAAEVVMNLLCDWEGIA